MSGESNRCYIINYFSYQSCVCPTDERFIEGSCQASTYLFPFFFQRISYLENGQCAPGRILCQNLLNCAESARICEQDHTQYTDSFKTIARCTFDQPNDGFNCYYSDNGLNATCIPFERFCDGHDDCPLGNDEAHCHKLTTTTPAMKTSKKCLTGQKCKFKTTI